jgi:hypothetical protein
MELKESYRERLQYFNEKLMALMIAVDNVITGGPTEGSQELIEQKLGEFCYTMELALYSGDISVANIALATGEEAEKARARMIYQPLALLAQLEAAMKPRPEVKDV